MKFSENVDDNGGGNFTKKEIYMGKANYKVVAVNPNKDELKALNQFVPEDEPVYTGKREINGTEYDLANITIYLQNPSDFSVIDRVTYTIVDNVQLSLTNKLAVMNKYGADTWLEESHIKAKTVPENMQWYVNEGVKTARRGEKELVSFIRALRNFKKISMTSTPEERENYVSQFEDADLAKLFKGDFSDMKSLLMSNPDAKVGFLLGARSADNGKVYQDMFKEYPMRSYMVGNAGSDEYIVKAVKEAQDNGRYANTTFNLSNLDYVKFDPSMQVQPDPVAGNDDEDDQLPF